MSSAKGHINTMYLDVFFWCFFFGLYHGKSPSNHYLGEYVSLFPSILSKFKPGIFAISTGDCRQLKHPVGLRRSYGFSRRSLFDVNIEVSIHRRHPIGFVLDRRWGDFLPKNSGQISSRPNVRRFSTPSMAVIGSGNPPPNAPNFSGLGIIKMVENCVPPILPFTKETTRSGPKIVSKSLLKDSSW